MGEQVRVGWVSRGRRHSGPRAAHRQDDCTHHTTHRGAATGRRGCMSRRGHVPERGCQPAACTSGPAACTPSPVHPPLKGRHSCTLSPGAAPQAAARPATPAGAAPGSAASAVPALAPPRCSGHGWGQAEGGALVCMCTSRAGPLCTLLWQGHLRRMSRCSLHASTSTLPVGFLGPASILHTP